MTKQLLVAAGLAALTSSVIAGPEVPPPAPAQTQTTVAAGSFYFGADGGLFWLQNRSFDLGFLPESADIHYKTGWGVTVPVGYNFGNGFSLGVSGGYYTADVDTVSVAGYSVRPGDLGVNIRTQLVPIYAEAAYTCHIGAGFSWDIGGGIGAAYTRDSAAGYAQSEWDFSFEGTTGISYQVCPNAAVRLGYRYMWVDQKNTSSLNGHSLELGFRLNF